jgi:radical SAM superfamily enzyme YgiQ (UPF0313 family)
MPFGCPILLVNCPYPRVLKFPGQPTSLLYAASLAVGRAERIAGPGAVRLLNYNLMPPRRFRESGAGHFQRALLALRPTLIAFSSTTASLADCRRLAAIAKSIPNPPVVVSGGPHDRDAKHPLATWDEHFDFSIKGSGESIFADFVDAALEFGPAVDRIRDRVAGLSSDRPAYGRGAVYAGPRSGSRRSLFGPPDPIAVLDSANRHAGRIALDELPFPPRHLLEPAERYHYPIFLDRAGEVEPTVQVMTARGCMHKCTFCSEAVTPEWRSVERVALELDGLRADGYRAVFFDDSTFTAPEIRRRTQFVEVLGRHLRQLGFRWGCQTRVDCVTPGLLRQLRADGCEYVYFGIESFVPAILDALGKGYGGSADAVDAALIAARLAGLAVGVSVLIGAHDGRNRTVETLDTAISTFRRVRKYCDDGPIRVVSVNLMTHYPGTKGTEKMSAFDPNLDDDTRPYSDPEHDEYPYSLAEECSNRMPFGLPDLAPSILRAADEILGPFLHRGDVRDVNRMAESVLPDWSTPDHFAGTNA